MRTTLPVPYPQTAVLPTDRLAQNPAAVYLASLAEGSRRTMRQALDVIAGLVSDGQADALTLPWAALRKQHTDAIRSKLAEPERYAPATANKMRSALRGVLRKAWELELMTAEEYQRAAAIERIPGQRLPAGRSLTPGELDAMLAVCNADQSLTGVRDGALIAVLYGAGLRRGEVASLDLADFGGDRVTVRAGKGNKSREVPLPTGAAEAMADWLAVRGDHAGALFAPIRKGGHLQDGRLTGQAVWHIVQERAKAAGVKDISPHDFRRTFVGDLLDAGADIAIVQRLAGHANVTTTARYDRRPEEAKRRAVRLLHVPYRRVLRSK